MSQNQPQNKYVKVIDYFLYLLAKKDYPQKVLIQKAHQKNYPETDIDEGIRFLLAKNYLNEQRLADNIIEKYPTCGSQFWQQKMAMAGIEPQIIKQTIQKNQTDHSLLKKQLETKFRLTSWQLEPEIKAKIARFIAARGVSNAFGLLQKWSQKD